MEGGALALTKLKGGRQGTSEPGITPLASHPSSGIEVYSGPNHHGRPYEAVYGGGVPLIVGTLLGVHVHHRFQEFIVVEVTAQPTEEQRWGRVRVVSDPLNGYAFEESTTHPGEYSFRFPGLMWVDWRLGPDVIASRRALSRLYVVRDLLKDLIVWEVPPLKAIRVTKLFMVHPGEDNPEDLPVYGEERVEFQSFVRPAGTPRGGQGIYMTHATAGHLSFEPQSLFKVVHSLSSFDGKELPTRVMGCVATHKQGKNAGKTFVRWVPLKPTVNAFLTAIRRSNFVVTEHFRETIVGVIHGFPFYVLGEFLCGNDQLLHQTDWGTTFAAMYGIPLAPLAEGEVEEREGEEDTE